jgi:hypothetical protein
MELTDPNLSTSQLLGNLLTLKEVSDFPKPPLKGDGWGSPQATEMVLNNLFYVTVKVCMANLCDPDEYWMFISPNHLGIKFLLKLFWCLNLARVFPALINSSPPMCAN